MSALPPLIVLDPATVIEEGALWTIALNSNQNLLGKTMLALRRRCGSVADLTGEEFTDVHRQIRRICKAVDALFAPDLYNHCFLMNLDRQVHLHVVPRYEKERVWDGETFTDPHWGTLFGREQNLLSEERLRALATEVRSGLSDE